MKTNATPTTGKLASVILIALLGFTVGGTAQEGTWGTRTSMPTARMLLATSVVNGLIYAIGGGTGLGFGDTAFATVEVYDPVTDLWTKKTDMPTPNSGLSTSVVDGIIYAIGGDDGNKSLRIVQAYNPATDTWTQKADMPTARSTLSTSVVNGRIYAIGGLSHDASEVFSEVEVYDPATDTWTKKANMPTARGCVVSVAVDGKIYVIGGASEGSQSWRVYSTVEVYDTVTDIWTKKANMPTARIDPAVSLVNGKIYVVGGTTDGTWPLNHTSSAVEVYDPSTDTWVRQIDMPTPRVGPSAGVVDGKIYVIGGWREGNVLHSTVEVFDTGVRTGEVFIRVTSTSPRVGSTNGSDSLSIVGSGFPLDAVVTIGGKPLSEREVTEGQITGIVPPGEAGERDILIAALSIDFTVFAGKFSYIVPGDFVVVEMTPSNGAQKGGGAGHVTGGGFREGAAITVGEVSATDVTVNDETHITFTIPPGAEGTKDLIVTNPDGQERVLQASYTHNPFPVIESIEPDDGPVEGGTQILITGNHFMPGAIVTIGGVQVERPNRFSPTEMRPETPPATPGPKLVRVVNPDGQEDAREAGFTHIVTLIPEANLRGVLESALSKAPRDSITADELATLTVLDARGRNISDLIGLEHATQLTDLQLSLNIINDVRPLAVLTNLRELRLNNNKINDVSSLAVLANLTELDLRSNDIIDVSPLAALTNLRDLRLDNNDIIDVNPLAALTNLTRLELVGNDITDVRSLAALSNLTHLGLNDNQINDVSPLLALTNLTRLALGQNPLNYEAITVHIPALQDRGVRVVFNNRVSTTLAKISGDGQVRDAVTSLPIPLVVEVKDQTGATFEGVPVTFSVTAGEGALTVEEMTTDENGLAQTTLTLGVSVGPHTVEVRAADISTPSIFTAHVPVPIPDAGLRTALEAQMGKNSGDPITTTELETLPGLSAPDHDISDLTGLEYAINLTTLRLGNNQIDDVSLLASLANLTDLRLGNNEISDVSPLADLIKLTRLELSSNEINDVSPLTALTDLMDLRLSTNEINDISPLADLTNLTRLELFSNQIQDVNPLADLTNLTHLELFSNRISNLSPLADLTNLTTLRLSANDISDLSALEGLTNLETLELSANIISNVGPLEPLTSLTTLELSANQIRHIKPLVQNTGIDSGDTVRLLRNPLTYGAIGKDIPALEGRGVTVLIISPRSVPNTLVKVSGDNQTGELKSTLVNPFVVRVDDQRGNPFEGVPVTFSVTTGDGSLTVENVNTDANGLAETTLTLGESAGTNTVEVSAAEIDAPEIFTAGNIAVEIVVESIQPPGGPLDGGTEVTITGGVFNEETQVTIGGLPLSNLQADGLTRLTGTTPPGEEGPQDVVVLRGGQPAVLKGGFRYSRPPTIEGIDPTGGVFGTKITVHGKDLLENLSDQSIDVRVGDVPGVDIQFESPERLTFTAPFLPSGRAYPVTVFNPDDQQSQERIVFTYNSPPRITEVSPSRGKVTGGTAVRLRGENFICEGIGLEMEGTAVEFNERDCSPTELRFRTPPGSRAGTVDIVVTNSDGQPSSRRFTYTSPPIVHSVAPEIGNPDGNTRITIHGENLLEAVEGGSIAVKIGGVDAESVRRFSDTEISARTPPTETPGSAVRLIVIGPEGQESSEEVTFTYNHRLDISGISPRMGAAAGDTEVTISGAGFTDMGTDPFKVSLGDQEADVVQLVSPREVIIRTPAGSPGTVVDVIIENGDGQRFPQVGGFTYTETLAAMDLSPRVGSLDGGDSGRYHRIRVYGRGNRRA